ncbi:MAG: peptidylprolyl isomerase [Elusimicrobia bacterium]|nr:peptidylprolyl isomerase [Elusimicrobiota bacterium]MBU2615442.1 peptidylprolyl isomerase [Elusimicrobiota bacterium]
MKKQILLVLGAIIMLNGTDFAADKVNWTKEKGLYAAFETSMGTIVCKLFEKETPKTVANFVDLATGKKKWFDQKNQKMIEKKPLYDGTIFHRVIPDFMIQGGDPLGTGFGGPGYKFDDEIVPNYVFDKPGKLAMANAGPNTNGSQFFITCAATPWLNGKHTIFGEVVSDYAIVQKIVAVPRDSHDKPTAAVTIKKLTIKKIK